MSRPVTQDWTHSLTLMQQSVLLTAVRGPDGLPKYGGCKMLLRWYRRCILISSFFQRVLVDPIESDGGSFLGSSLSSDANLAADEPPLDPWPDRMQTHVNQYLRELDAIPHHFQMHLLHAVEIIGYKHPDTETRDFWHKVYLRLVNDMHVHPETESEMDKRLGDSRDGWLARADVATVL